MQFDIPSTKEQEQIIRSAVREELKDLMPKLLKGQVHETWLDVNGLVEKTGWSRSTIFSLKDQGLIPYSQHGRKVLFPWGRIEAEFIEKNLVEPKG